LDYLGCANICQDLGDVDYKKKESATSAVRAAPTASGGRNTYIVVLIIHVNFNAQQELKNANKFTHYCRNGLRKFGCR
jgi:hypothetical protein